jgi:nucleoside-diphosphate-sugar epimerase
MAILVTGGTGFVGLNLVEALLARGDSVVIPSDGPLPKMAEPVFTRLPGTADPRNWLRARRPSGRGCG